MAQMVMVSFQVAEHPELMGEFSMMELLLRYFLGNLSVVMLFIAPLLTMRLYAEERKSGTIELLFTYPVTDAAAVAGKFAACLTALSVLIAATLPGVIAVALISTPAWKVILSGYAGMFLLGCAFLSLGTFASTLTRNQIIAAVISFGVLLVLWFTRWGKGMGGPGVGKHSGIYVGIQTFRGTVQGLDRFQGYPFLPGFLGLFSFPDP